VRRRYRVSSHFRESIRKKGVAEGEHSRYKYRISATMQ
jgi:hypothetical protein